MAEARGRARVVAFVAAIVAVGLLILLAARGSSDGAGSTAAAAQANPGAQATADARANAAAPANAGGKHPVIFVGNNWEGTADVISTRGKNFRLIDRINIVPDFDERIDEIMNPLNPKFDPERLGYFLAIREAVGEGHDQLVDDMYSTPDGRLLVVSRPSFKDVIGLRLAGPKTGEIKWRFEVAGQRSDHMAVSPDGEQVAVSASTGNVVHLLDTDTGDEEGTFMSGDSPHENTYSADGKRIYHASIGLVYTPGDEGAIDTDTNKGERVFQVVDTKTQKIISKVDMGQKLEEAGYPDLSAAVRPMAITANEKRAFLQVSFFHGVVEYNLRKEKVVRVTRLPNLSTRNREQYLLDSAHHGIALSGNDKRLCIAGTESDYATVVSRKRLRKKPSLEPKLIEKGLKPYWSTTSANGKHCYVSWSGTDDISVISYRKRKEIAHIPVGDEGGQPAHPQRIRNGFVRDSFVAANR